jgi:hypothetical protein
MGTSIVRGSVAGGCMASAGHRRRERMELPRPRPHEGKLAIPKIT